MKTLVKHNTISLSKIFDKSISSRSAIVNLFRNMDAEIVHDITINFNHISFISRSASHQLITEKRKFEKKDIKVVFANMSSTVEEMLDVVTEALDKPKKTPKVYHLRFSSQKNLHKFLLRV